MATRIERMGRWINADEVFEAWMSNDLRRMLAARSIRTNAVDRHFLLQGIVKETYKRRNEAGMRQLCIETGLLHLHEFPTLVPGLRKDMGGSLPRVPSFAKIATALAEEGRLDEAIQVTKAAADLGLDDGTEGGYVGRAQRLAKKRGSA